MSHPIYKLYRAKFSPAWYQLDPSEREALLTQMRHLREEIGGQRVMSCSCRWATESWDMFGIEAYPDLETLQRFSQALADMGWFQYVEGDSLLGTDWYASGAAQ